MKGKFGTVEEKYERPMRDILIDLFEQFGSQQEVADYLNVSQSTISIWLLKSGLIQKTVLVERGT